MRVVASTAGWLKSASKLGRALANATGFPFKTLPPLAFYRHLKALKAIYTVSSGEFFWLCPWLLAANVSRPSVGEKPLIKSA